MMMWDCVKTFIYITYRIVISNYFISDRLKKEIGCEYIYFTFMKSTGRTSVQCVTKASVSLLVLTNICG